MNRIATKLMDGKEGSDALFLYATEGILVVNGEGVIMRINPSAAKLFGYETHELIGKKIEVLVPRRLDSKHVQHRDRYNTNPHARSMGVGTDLYALKKDGSEFSVEISLSPYSSEGKQFVVAFIIDITERKEAEARLKNYSGELEEQVKNRTLILEEAINELEKTKRILNIALSREKELNELKTRFVSMASHEFRTPLTTMMSSLSLVTRYGENNDKDSQSKHVAKIKASINHLTDILNDFLSVSKLEEGRVENFPEPLNLHGFVSDVISEMQSLTVKDQQIVLTFSGNEYASLDAKIVRNIFFNLISNAIKFSHDDGLIEVGIQVLPASVTISVTDYGIGISKKDQQQLFERFFRGHNATNIQGTGLGLNIVAKYVELINGKIQLESDENQGTRFTVYIPQ